MKSIWENISALTVVLNWDDDSTVERYKDAFQDLGVSDVQFLVLFASKQEKEQSKLTNAHSVGPKDLNWLKNVKTEELKSFLSKKHSALMFVGTPNEKYKKIVKKIKSNLRFGVNSELKSNRLSFSTPKENPSEIVYFVKQNLEKIYE